MTALAPFALELGLGALLFVVFVVERLGRDGTDVGIIRGTMAVGAVLGAAVITRGRAAS